MEQGGAGVLGGGVTCFGCLYDLRGQPTGGVCPECGESIARSVEGGRLDRANRGWLRIVRLGVLLVAGEYVLALAGFGISRAVPVLADEKFAAVVVAAMGVCAKVAAWLLTMREPGRGSGVRAGMLRVAGLLGAWAYFVMAWELVVMFTSWPWERVIIGSLMGMGFVRGVLLVSVMRSLVRRMPGRREVWATWVVQALVAATWAIGVVATTTNVLDWADTEVFLLMAATCVAVPALVVWVWYAIGVEMRRR